METKELNEWIFADLIDNRALRLYQRDAEKLIAQDLPEEEIQRKMLSKQEYITKALASLKVTKKLVSSALEESEK